jgi:hypothetical protein
LFRALLRTNFNAFVEKAFATLAPGQDFDPGWHLQAIAYQLERLRRGEITRLIINMPPRSLKSVTASVAFPAFVLGHDPTRRIICVSYSGDLAKKHANDFRAVAFRRRERAMQRFRSLKTLQKFSSVHAQVHNQFNQERHLVTRQVYKQRRSAALAEWRALVA